MSNQSIDIKTQRQHTQLAYMMKKFCTLFIEIERLHQHMQRKEIGVSTPSTPTKNCTPAEIKDAIREAGTSQTAIAEYLNLSVANVSQVVNGKGRSQIVEAELTKIIGRPPFGQHAGKGPSKTTWDGKEGAAV